MSKVRAPWTNDARRGRAVSAVNRGGVPLGKELPFFYDKAPLAPERAMEGQADEECEFKRGNTVLLVLDDEGPFSAVDAEAPALDLG